MIPSIDVLYPPLSFRIALPILMWLCSLSLSIAQFTLKGDLYVARKAQIHVAVPKTVFLSGTVVADRGTDGQYGLVSFGSKSITERADHNTHINGFVRSYNKENFIYPIGHDNILQPVHFKSEASDAVMDFAYAHAAHQSLEAESSLEKVSDEFYWSIKGQGDSRIHFSWNTFSNLDKLTDNKLENLTIAAFDGAQWKNIPAQLDEISFEDGNTPTLLSGSISSIALMNPSLYSAITLARIDSGGIYDFEVSQAITPNGDGVNDTWFVEDILDHPNSSIRVFNRLGQVVFEAIGYQNDWHGNYKNNSESLPETSYFFTIDLENDGTVDKTGWLYITQ